MQRTAYVNGSYVPLDQAVVSIQDRGFLFADGVYEVIALIGGVLADLDAHLDRLERSLAGLQIDPPMTRRALGLVMAELVRKSRLRFGMLYVQITRGAAPRDHAFPAGVRPGLAMTCTPIDLHAIARRTNEGVRVISVDEARWASPHIKSVSLLANVLAKQEARSGGAHEALFVGTDDTITEGSSTNVWMVDGAGRLMTRAADDKILAGITRQVLFGLARDEGLTVVEEGFTVADAAGAAELFLSSTTGGVVPVTHMDGAAIGGGAPGPVAHGLAQRYRAHLAAQTADREVVLARLSDA